MMGIKHPILWCFFLLNIVFLLILFYFSTKGMFLQLGVPGIRHYQLNGLFLLSVLISGVFLIHFHFHDKGLTFIAIFLSSSISFFILINGLFQFEAKYSIFSSPNNEEHFVVFETGHGDLYQIVNGLFIKHLADIRTDDGYKPFDQGTYLVEWKCGNKFTVKYAMDAIDSLQNTDYYKEITVTYQPTQGVELNGRFE